MSAPTLPNLLFIPSQLLTQDLWAPQIAFLADRASCFVANHGEHDRISQIAHSILDNTPGPLSVVALGMGGFISFEMLRQAAPCIQRLLLINTLATADNAAQTARRMGYLKLVEDGHFEQVIEERLSSLIPPSRQNDKELIAVARKMASDTGAERFLRQQKAIMAREDSTPSLPAIQCPVHIIHGSSDGITNLTHHQHMLSHIPHATFQLIEGGGHLLPLECPEIINAAIQEWLG